MEIAVEAARESSLQRIAVVLSKWVVSVRVGVGGDSLCSCPHRSCLG